MDILETLNIAYGTCNQKLSNFFLNSTSCGLCSSLLENNRSIHEFCLNTSVRAVTQWAKIPDLTRTLDMDIAVPLYGYGTPVLCVVILILNSLMVVILSRKGFRSSTNVLLLAIAVFDGLTITFPLPWYIHQYSMKHYTDYSTYGWCVFHDIFATICPTVCHNCSIWLTVLLALHRYAGVTCTKRCGYLSTYKAIFVGISIIVLLTLLLHATSFYMDIIEHVRVISKKLVSRDGVVFIDTCKKTPRLSNDKYITYMRIYLWIRTIFVQIIPILMLSVFNVLLLRTLCKSYRYRRHLVGGSSRVSKSDRREVIRTSTMLVTICVFTWFVEVPQSLMLICVLLQKLHGVRVFEPATTKIYLTAINFILFLFLPSNFAIFFGLSSKFRRTIYWIIKWRSSNHSAKTCTTGVSSSLIGSAGESMRMVDISNKLII